MADLKYFTTTKKGDIPELREELMSPDRKNKTSAMKKIVANITMGNDMSALFNEVLSCMQTSALDLKKLVYLYLVNYAKVKPDMAVLTVNSFIRDAEDPNPLIRGLAIRTMAYIELDKITEAMSSPLRKCLRDQDPYVRKTAALCVGKFYKHDSRAAQNEGFVDMLKDLLQDTNATVVSNALATLVEIDRDKEGGIGLTFDFSTVMKFLTALNESSEWGQVYIMEALTSYVPRDSGEAEVIVERVSPRLNHANSAVILSSIKLMMHCFNYITTDGVRQSLPKRLSPSLVTMLRSGRPEIQYVALRNILLLMQKIPNLFDREMKVFFCEYNDPIYVKMTKLEVLMRIANDDNIEQILAELKEYSSEIDVDFVRKAVRAIGICAVKIERSANRCIEVLLELIQTKVNYVVQEAIVVIKNIFRKYPNRYESIIGTLCENLDTLDEPDAKASMIWIIGHYADRIDNADELLSSFMDSFLDEPADVQLSLLTAVVKLFLHRPNSAEELIKKIFKWGTENVDNPDLRDRAFIYWRLLSTDPVGAKAIVLSEKPLSTEGTLDNLDGGVLQELLGHIGSLASIYHKPATGFAPRTGSAAAAALAAAKAAGARSLSSQNGGSSAVAPALKEVPRSTMMGNDYRGGPAASTANQTSVGGSVGVMNLLDLDLDEPAAYEPEAAGTTSSSSGVDDQLADLSLGGAPANYLAGLDFGLGGGGGGGGGYGMASPDQSLVQPKQVLLQAKNAQGLEISGTFARRGGKVFLDLTFGNRAMQPLHDFAFQFNTNSFGLTPAGPLEVRSPLPPNTTAETSLQLVLSPMQRARKDPLNLLQIAVKSNVGVFYFQAFVHLHILFPENGGLERSDYLRQWKEIPEANEHVVTIAPVRFASVDAVRRKLHVNNVFMVAERQVEDRTLVYCSTCVLPDKAPMLVELTFDASLQSCSAATKTVAPEYTPAFEEALAAILRSA